jgi:hypothetical protein
MDDLVPKNGSSTSNLHIDNETPNLEIYCEQSSFQDWENIEQNLDNETKITYAVSNEEVNTFN